MSYQVLARKWRPKSFATLVGQEATVRALSNALAQQRLHHAYLFTGTRGVGKTTLARILAKALNCETGITAEPCGVCSACQQIDSGRFVDLIELDAASNTGVDNIREVLDNAQYAPTSGRFKVYIIDEVHMLSKSAFNAMLKTLEEPPGHVKFILATTDPQKVPVTVLSRCLQFNLRPMTPALVAAHLARVLQAEEVTFESDALRQLAHAASGSMRDALSLLDQAIAYGSGSVLTENVRQMLGNCDRGYLQPLLQALMNMNGAEVIAAAAAIEARGLDCDTVLEELAEFLHWVSMAQIVPEGLSEDLLDRELIESAAALWAAEDVQLYYQIVIHGRRDLPLAPDPGAGLRMTLLRLLAFRPLSGGNKTIAPSAPASSASKPAAPASIGKAAAPPSSAPAAKAVPISVREAAAPTPEVATPAVAETTPAADFDGDWPALVQLLRPGGVARMLALEAALEHFDQQRITLLVPPDKPHLTQHMYVDTLRDALQKYFGRPIQLQVRHGDGSGQSLSRINATVRAEKQRDAEDGISSDPFVQSLQQEFGASVIDVRPL